MEAVKQGSATVGLKSRTHAVLVALKVALLAITNPIYHVILQFTSICKHTDEPEHYDHLPKMLLALRVPPKQC